MTSQSSARVSLLLIVGIALLVLVCLCSVLAALWLRRRGAGKGGAQKYRVADGLNEIPQQRTPSPPPNGPQDPFPPPLGPPSMDGYYGYSPNYPAETPPLQKSRHGEDEIPTDEVGERSLHVLERRMSSRGMDREQFKDFLARQYTDRWREAAGMQRSTSQPGLTNTTGSTSGSTYSSPVKTSPGMVDFETSSPGGGVDTNYSIAQPRLVEQILGLVPSASLPELKTPKKTRAVAPE